MANGIRYLIAADGGGSGCRVAVARRGDGAVLAEAAGGPANLARDFDGALAALRAALDAALAGAGLDRKALGDAACHLALAGGNIGDLARRAAASVPAARVGADDERAAAAEGALGPRDGVVAALGTGSFLVRKAGGRLASLGGWGLALGDEASGAWLGRALAAHALRAHDGLEPGSPLTRALVTEHGSPEALAAWGLAAGPGAFAALAPRVVEAAEAGDPVAGDIMRAGAGYVVAGVEALGAADGEALCLAGGLGPAYALWLPPGLAARLVPPAGRTLDGALALAARLAEAGP